MQGGLATNNLSVGPSVRLTVRLIPSLRSQHASTGLIAAIPFRQTCGYFHRLRSPLPLGLYPITLLGDRGTPVWITCGRLASLTQQLHSTGLSVNHKSNPIPNSSNPNLTHKSAECTKLLLSQLQVGRSSASDTTIRAVPEKNPHPPGGQRLNLYHPLPPGNLVA